MPVSILFVSIHRLIRTPITTFLFRETSGEVSQAQFHAFTDTWTWADADETYTCSSSNSPMLRKGTRTAKTST
jgi:hypothetical protein